MLTSARAIPCCGLQERYWVLRIPVAVVRDGDGVACDAKCVRECACHASCRIAWSCGPCKRGEQRIVVGRRIRWYAERLR